MTRVHLAGVVRIRTVVFVQTPTLARDLRDRVDAISQDAPIALAVNRVARETAPEADDGNGFVLFRRRHGCFHSRIAQKIIRNRLDGWIFEDQSGGKRAAREVSRRVRNSRASSGSMPMSKKPRIRSGSLPSNCRTMRCLVLNESNQFFARPGQRRGFGGMGRRPPLYPGQQGTISAGFIRASEQWPVDIRYDCLSLPGAEKLSQRPKGFIRGERIDAARRRSACDSAVFMPPSSRDPS